MTDWQATRALFEACVDASGEDRQTLLAQASTRISKEVTDLLAVADRESPPCERYRAISILDTGGCGLVFLAHDEVTQDKVILKMFRVRTDKHQEASRSLSAHLAASEPKLALTKWLDGNIGRDRIGWIISEPFQGKPFLDWIKTDTPGLNERIKLFEAIAQSMEAATDHGLPATWPKPTQVLVGPHDKLALTDLGLVAQFAVDPNQTLTQPINTMHSLADMFFENVDMSAASDPHSLIKLVEQTLP